MNYKTFDNMLNTGRPVQIQIIKKSQVYGHHKDNLFLTNRSNHPYAVYPVSQDPATHLNPGQILTVLSVHKPNKIYRPSCIKVESASNQQFYIMQCDFKRFIKIV